KQGDGPSRAVQRSGHAVEERPTCVLWWQLWRPGKIREDGAQARHQLRQLGSRFSQPLPEHLWAGGACEVRFYYFLNREIWARILSLVTVTDQDAKAVAHSIRSRFPSQPCLAHALAARHQHGGALPVASAVDQAAQQRGFLLSSHKRCVNDRCS